jgi:hypothetical protein
MYGVKMESIPPFNTKEIRVFKGEIWSCYPINFTPNDLECKNIIVKIEQENELIVVVNCLKNDVRKKLSIKDVYLVYKLV